MPGREVFPEFVVGGFVLLLRQEDAQHDDSEHDDEANLEDIQTGLALGAPGVVLFQAGIFPLVAVFCHFLAGLRVNTVEFSRWNLQRARLDANRVMIS